MSQADEVDAQQRALLTESEDEEEAQAIGMNEESSLDATQQLMAI
jgi:hypothetical protein